jgi:valyl-tRNA synthetase
MEILARFDELLQAVEIAYGEYRFNEIAQRLYDFFWRDYCDWFIEAAKTEIFGTDDGRKKSVLMVMDLVLSGFLRLLHPFMPHITEELWSVMAFDARGDSGKSASIQFASAPVSALSSISSKAVSAARESVARIYETVQAGRNLRATSRVPSNKKVRFVLRPASNLEKAEIPTMTRLMNADEITLDAAFEAKPGLPLAVTPLGELFLVIEDADQAVERERLDKELAKLESEIRIVDAKLANPSFVDRAPAAIVQEHRQRKVDFSEQLLQLKKARAALD